MGDRERRRGDGDRRLEKDGRLSAAYLGGVRDDEGSGVATVSKKEGGQRRQWRATCPATPQAKQMGLLSGVRHTS